MTKGIFGNMFDFNRDGEMSIFERAAEFSFVNHLMTEAEKEEKLAEMEDEQETDEFGLDEFKISELEMEGLDLDELSFMDEWERREAIENAGLDPDDYDFD